MKKINPEAIQIYLKKLHERGSSASEIHKKLASVDKFIDWAREKGYINKTQFKQVKETIANFMPINNYSTVFGKDQKSTLEPEKAKTIHGKIPFKAKYFIHHILKYIPLLSSKHQEAESKEKTHFEPFENNRNLAAFLGFILILLFVSVLGAGLYSRFFKNTQTPFAYPATFTTPSSRFISFQGRLTDSLGNPITAATNVKFQLYNTSSGSTAVNLYTTGACSITPDQDGIFNSLIGSDCGPTVPNSVFTENTDVYLGVIVGTDAEMTPRQHIANVGYAINAETLQGLPPGTSASNIAFIDSSGTLAAAPSNTAVASTTQYLIKSTAKLTGAIGTAQTNLYAEYAVPTIGLSGGASNTLTNYFGDYVGLGVSLGTVTNYYANYVAAPTGAGTVSNKYAFVSEAGAGKVGIGTTAPTEALVLAGASDNISFSNATGPHQIMTGGSTNLAFIPGGNVGIGTTVPINKLEVSGSADITGNLGVGTTAITNTITVGGNASIGVGYTGVAAPTNGLIIQGNAGIGSTGFTGATLDVAGTLRIGTTNSASSNTLCLGTNNIVSACSASSSLTGTGLNNYLARWTSATNLSTGVSYDNGTSVGIGYTNPDATSVLVVNGNVGIGTTIPRNKLDVNGSVAIGALPGAALPQSNSLYVSGNVGLGYTAPANKLDIAGSVAIGYTGLAAPANGLIVVGNVGIGNTSSTGYALDVTGTIRGQTIEASGPVKIGTTGAAASNTLCLGTNNIVSACSASSSLTGVGVSNYLARWTSATNLSTGISYDNGTSVGIGFTNVNSSTILTVNGNIGIGTTNALAFLEIASTAPAGATATSYAFRLVPTLNGTLSSTFPQTTYYSFYNVPTIGITSAAGTAPQLRNLFIGYNGATIGTGETVVNSYGQYIAAPTLNGTATITNKYGLVTEAGAGNIGLGTTIPVARLQITGNGTTTGLNFLAEDSNGVDKVVILDNGNVGIGTTSPVAFLEINSSTASGSKTLKLGATPSNGVTNYSIYNNVNASGSDTNLTSVYGIYNTGTASAQNSGTGTTAVVYGMYNFFTTTANGLANSENAYAYGIYNQLATSTTNRAESLYGLYNDITTTSNGPKNGYGVYYLTNANSTGSNQYVVYADMTAGTATKAGIYINGDTKNSLSGNLGIGTTTPVNKLDVIGAVSIGFNGSTAAPSNGLIVNGNVGIGSTGFTGATLDVAGTLRIGTTNSASSNTLCLGTNNIVSACSASSSLTGVGVSNYLARWTSATNISTGISYDNGSFVGIGYTAAAGSPSLIVNGNVGIGTTSPGAFLEISSTVPAGATAVSYAFKLTPTINGTLTSTFPQTSFYSFYNVASIGITSAAGTAPQLRNLFIGYNSATIGTGETIVNSYGQYVAAPTLNGTATITNKYALVTEAGAGNVGIGTTVPTAKLHLVGNGTTTGFNLMVEDSSGADKFIVQDNGNVGIGYTSPANKLDIAGSISLGYTGIAAPANGGIFAGNVGIATSAPGARLQINDTGGGDIIRLYMTSSWNQYYYSDIGWTTGTSATGKFQYGKGFSNDSEFQYLLNGSLKMTLNTSALGVFASNPGSTLGVGGNAAIGASYAQLGAPSNGLIVQGNAGIGSTGFTGATLDVAGALRVGTTNAAVNAQTLCLGTNNILSACTGGGGSITGTGVLNYLARWTSATNISTGISYDNGSFVGIGYTAAAGSPSLIVNGNVGIGTTSPGAFLEISSTVPAGATAVSYAFKLTPTINGTLTSTFPQTSFYSFYNVASIGITSAAGTAPHLRNYFADYIGGTIANAGQTVSNSYGLYIAALTGNTAAVTNKYALVTEQGAGGVGIGTGSTGPNSAANLEVANTSGAVLRLSNSNTNQITPGALVGKIDFWTNTQGNDRLSASIGGYSNSFGGDTDLTFGTNNFGGNSPTEKMRIKASSGYVGINTTAPGAFLELYSGQYSGNGLLISNIDEAPGTNFDIKATGSGGNVEFSVQPDSTTRTTPHKTYFRGNVGIGTTAPNNKLDVVGAVAIGSYAGANTAPSNGLIVSGNAGIGSTGFTGATLDVAGTLRIGTTNGASTNTLCLGTNNIVSACSASSSLTGVGLSNYLARWTSATNLSTGISYDNGTTVGIGYTNVNSAGVLEINGNVGIGTTSPTAPLDIRPTAFISGSPYGTFIGTTVTSGSATGYGSYTDIYRAGGTNNLYGAYYNIHNDTSSASSNYLVGVASKVSGGGYISKGLTAGLFTATTGAFEYSNMLAGIGITVDQGPGNSNMRALDIYMGGASGGGGGTTMMGLNLVSAGSGDTVYGAKIDFSSASVPAFLTGVYVNTANKGTSKTYSGIFTGGNFGIGTTAPINQLDVNNSVAIGSLPTTALPQSNSLYVSGNVGIGTTNPSAALHVNGDAWANRFMDTSNSAYYIDPAASGAGNYNLVFSTGLAYFAGNVGIGVSLPVNKFDVAGSAAFGTYGGTAATASNSVIFGGNIGIGTTNAVSQLQLVATATTGTASQFIGNSLTSGTLLSLASTNQNITSGGLLALDFQPAGSSTAFTGDLLSVNVGVSAMGGNLLNLKNNGSSLFAVSQTQVLSNIPAQFAAPGDVSVAYDLNFTNQTSSFIKSNAPLTLQAGESFESNDLTLQTFNNGDVVLNSPGGVVLAQAQPWTLGIGTTSTTALNIQSGLLDLDTTNSRVGIGTTAPSTLLQLNGSSPQITLYDTVSNVGGVIGNNSNLSFGGGGTAPVLNLGFSAGAGTVPYINFRMNATNIMTIMGNSNIGMGTTLPDQQLSIVGATSYKNTSNTTEGYIGVSGTNGAYLSTLTANDMFLRSQTNMLFGINTTEAMRITNGGNVGIGTSAPKALLDVNGTSKFQGNMVLTTGYSAIGDQGSMVPNSSFEINTTGNGTVPDGWTCAVNAGSGTCATSSAQNTNGANSEALTSSSGGVDDVSVLSACFPISELGTYNIRAYVKSSAATTGGLVLRVRRFTSLSNCQSNTGGLSIDGVINVATTTSWAEYGASTANAAGYYWGRAEAENFHPNVTATFYIDGFRVSRSSVTVGLDLAEVYPVLPTNTPQPGDLVTLGTVSSDAQTAYAVKTNSPYEKNIFGVVSTEPGLLLDDGKEYLKAKIALSGRVPTKVTTENGPIAVGDWLTASSIPGVAMKATKAGYVIGKALETYDNSDPTVIGKINVFINLNWYEPPTMMLASTGDVKITTSPTSGVGNSGPGTYNLLTNSGEIVTRIAAFAEVAAAKIKAGFVEMENAVISGTLAAKNIVADSFSSTTANIDSLITRNFIATEKIQSPIVETGDIVATGTADLAKIKTDEINPKNNDLTINLSGQPGQTSPTMNNAPLATSSGPLAKLVIKGLEGKTVATIDAGGNASFSGTLAATRLSANEASISGTLAAGQIQSENVKTQNLNSNEASISGTLIAKNIESDNINEIQRQLAEIRNQPLANPQYYQNIDSSLQSVVSSQNTSPSSPVSSLQTTDLIATGTSNLYNLSVANSLTIGSIFAENDSILSLSWDLKLSALSTVRFFDDAVVISKDGNLTTKGSVIAQGGVKTGEIRALNNGQDINVVLQQDTEASKSAHFNIADALGNINASVDASGAATFKSLGLEKYLDATSSAALLTPTQNFTKNGLFVPAIETKSESAGVGQIPANQTEVVIYNSSLNDSSLVYLTSTTTTPTNLTVTAKETCKNNPSPLCKPYFKVTTNGLSTSTTPFNWLIVK